MTAESRPDPEHAGGAGTLARRLWMLTCLFFAGGLWGLSPSLARFAIEEGAAPLGLTLWQAIGGGTLLLSISLARGRPVPVSRRHRWFYLVCGVLGTAMPTYLFFSVSRHLPAGITSMVIAAVPLMTYAIALALRLETLAPLRVLGVLLGFVAVLVLVLPGTALTPGTPAVWVLVALLLPVCYSAENMVLALRRPSGDDIALVAGMLLVSAALLLPLVLATSASVDMWPPWSRAQWATVGLVLVNVVSYTFFLYTVKEAGPVFAAQAGYLSMLCGVAAGVAIHDETHTAWFWAALLLMLMGMVLVRERAVVRVEGGGG